MLLQAQAFGERQTPRRWPAVVALITLCGTVLVASFVRSDLTRNDFERFDDLRLLFLFFALFAGLCSVYVSTYLQRYAVSPRAVAVTTVTCTLLLLASFPVGSKDVFAYSFFGKIWGLYHANPYSVTIADLPADPWQPFMQARWRNLPAAYGPLFLWQARLIDAAAGPHLWVAVWSHKGVAALVFLATLWMARRVLHDTVAEVSAASWLFVLLAWNPLFLFESAGGGHNDVVMVFLLLAALSSWLHQRFRLGLALLALSIWYKWYSVIFVPAFLLESLKVLGIRAALRQAAWCLGVTLVIGVVLLSPLPGSVPMVLGQLFHPAAMHGIYPNELSPPLAALFWSLKGLGLFDGARGGLLFDALRLALFIGAVAAILARQWAAAASFSALIESCCLLGCAFFLLLITMLLPWHLLTVIACGIVRGREPFLALAVGLTVLAMLSYFVTFAIASVMLIAVLTALWALRRLPRGGRAAVLQR